jgi:hypothetical protein
MEMNADNENEKDTWQTLAAPTARALIRSGFYEQQNEHREGDTDASGADEQREEHQRENIFQDVNKRAPQVRQVELRGRK